MPSYIGVPVETDADALTDRALDALMAAIPGFVPREGHLEVILLEIIMRHIAEGRDVASAVPTTIFRYFGKSLIGLPATEAAAATVTTSWTMVDNLGYTVPTGTLIGFSISGDELIPFRTSADLLVLPGNTTGIVDAEAVDPGETANARGPGAMVLIDALAFVLSVTATMASDGGVDAEEDEDYLDRLASELRLLTPRPILPGDFATLARRIAEVHRALALDGHHPGFNELQTVSTGGATGGTFTLTFAGQTTGAIAWNATAAVVQAALEALSNVNPGDVAVTGGDLGTTLVTIEFTGQYAKTNVAQMTGTSTLTGGGVTIATTRQGAAATNGNERTITLAVADEDGGTVSQAGKDAVDALLETEREVNFEVFVIDPTYTTINVTYTVRAVAGLDTPPILAAINAALTTYLSPGNWAGGELSPPEWRNETVVRFLEVATVINNVDGVDFIEALTVNGGTVDVALAGVAPLPTVGTLTSTVNAG